MSQISSINFKKSNAIQTRHNDRDLPPNYLIGGEIECNHTYKEALALKNQIIKNAIETYNSNKNPRAPRFKATSYEWSAVVNIKDNTTMQDLENLAKHFSDKYGFQCYQIAIHRDEGHINEQGEKQINHHAHLEFITLDRETGKNNYRRELISPKILRQIQTEVAEILQMERGKDKRISGAKRVEPRVYGALKEQEKDNTKELKKELQKIKTDLKKEILTKKEIKEQFEIFRKKYANKGLQANFFRELSNEKKEFLQAENPTQDQLDQFFKNLHEKHKGFLKANKDAIINELQETIQITNENQKTLKNIALQAINSYDLEVSQAKEEIKQQYEIKYQEKEKQLINAIIARYNTQLEQLNEQNLIKQYKQERDIALKEQQRIALERSKTAQILTISEKTINDMLKELKTLKNALNDKNNENEILKTKNQELEKENNLLKASYEKLIKTIKRACAMSFSCVCSRINNNLQIKSISFKSFIEKTDKEQEQLMKINQELNSERKKVVTRDLDFDM